MLRVEKRTYQEANNGERAVWNGKSNDYVCKDEYTDTLENLIHKTANGKFKKWEGIVASPAAGVFNRKGERIITKIKNKEYLP